MKPGNTNPKRHHTAQALAKSFHELEQMANGAAARKGGKTKVAGDPALLMTIAEKPRKAVTAASAAKPRPSTVKGDGKLKKVGKANPVQSRTVDTVATGVEPVGLPDDDESSLVESSSDDSSSFVSFSENEDWASESAGDYSDSYEFDTNRETKIPLAQQVPAKRTAGAPSRADRVAEGNRAKGKASLDAYFKGMIEKSKPGSTKKSVADQLKDSAFRDNGPVEFMQAFRTACKDFFSPMEAAIERSFDASLIKKGVKPKPEHNARRKHTTDAEQQSLDEALKNFDLGPMARFGKKLAHTLVAPLSFDARIKARLKGESFSAVAARAAFDQFPAGGKAMLKDVVASFWKLDDFHKLTPDEQEKTLRDAVTACIVTYGVNKLSLDTVKEKFTGQPELANGISAMALAQTYLKATFGLQHAVSGDSGAIAGLVSGAEKKRAGAFIDLLLEDACKGYVSTVVDPYSPANVATADEITGTMLRMVKDNPAAVDTKVAADVPRMSYALVGESGTVDLPCQSKASEKQSEARIAKVWDHIGHKHRNGFRRRIALCAAQELKNAVIKLAFESDGRFLQDYPGCLPRLDMATQVSITHLSSDKTKVRLEGSFDGAGKSVVLKRGGFDTIGELKDFRMRYVAEATISDLSADSGRPIKLGPIRFTMENLTVHPAA